MAAERRLYIRVDMATSKENSHSQPVCPKLTRLWAVCSLIPDFKQTKIFFVCGHVVIGPRAPRADDKQGHSLQRTSVTAQKNWSGSRAKGWEKWTRTRARATGWGRAVRTVTNVTTGVRTTPEAGRPGPTRVAVAGVVSCKETKCINVIKKMALALSG